MERTVKVIKVDSDDKREKFEEQNGDIYYREGTKITNEKGVTVNIQLNIVDSFWGTATID